MNLMPSRGFNLKLDYTITENTYDNLGFCISNTIGPFQIYTMIERIPLNWYSVKFSQNGQYIPLPYDEKSINFHFGLNLLFGNDQSYKIRKLKKDKPLVEPEDNW
jgi:uncharacterized protein (DUF39 family)